MRAVRLSVALLILVLFTGHAAYGAPQFLPSHPIPLEIWSPKGQLKAQITIEIAENPLQKAKGLMFRPELADSTGMWFPYDRPKNLSFWMRNTPEPLDILFIDTAKRIMRIHTWTTPNSDNRYTSDGVSIGALELSAGSSKRLGLAVGDRLHHPTVKAP